MSWKLILLVVGVFGALLLAGTAAYLVLGSTSDRAVKNEQTGKVANKRSTKAVVKSDVATKKADLSLQLNVKLVRCLTKRDAEALRRCLGLRPGAPGRPGAGGLDGTPGRTGPAGRALRGPRGFPGQSCSLPECRGPAGAPSVVPGPTGSTGESGPKGETGSKGADSNVAGPTGANGADSTVPGPQGPPGANGADSTVPGPPGPAGAPCPNTQVITTAADGPVTVCVP